MDDRLYNPDDFEIGDGVCNLPVTVSFHDLEPALESRSAGNAVNEIEQLWVVIYSVVNGKAVYYDKVKANTLPGYSVENGTTEPGDAETGDNLGPTGEATPRAKFTLNNIPFGRYQLYAVANLDLDDYDLSAEGQNNPDYLKSRTIAWETVGETENPDFSKINAMFGYFTPAEDQTSKGFEAPTLILNKETVNLHSWIKRLVSKVTIKFDASDLNESVHIYIKSVQILDIPKTCLLGESNTPSTDGLIHEGEMFTYYNPGEGNNTDHEKWKIILSRGKNSNLAGAINHSETDDALYFFENMQGNYPGQEQYNKEQQTEGNDKVGEAIDNPKYNDDGDLINDFKDKKLNGTYIEVKGYYESQNRDKLTEGPITYRFMLGKDVTYNYDAERNYHYKLTLKFRGWANEADWHISYKEHTPTLLVPDSYYISYLYGQPLAFPARILTGDESVKNYTVKAEIIENNWIPYDIEKNSIPSQFVGSYDDIYGFAWNEPAYKNIYKGANYVGFLSLRENKGDIIGQGYNYGSAANDWLKKYYDDEEIAFNEYHLSGNDNADFDEIDQSVSLTIPMYTRQKEMVPASDFTGNNPFNCYSRVAVVKFTLIDPSGNIVTFKDSEDNDCTEKECRIIQVPRIENPKAIYRDNNNKDPFKIELKVLKGAGSKDYVNYSSVGPWRASILCQTEDFIRLKGDDNQKVEKIGEYIKGSTDEDIIFTYEPKSTIGPKDTRCGIIKVEYNDYNCVHLIFVRQGYHKGVYLGDANWSCYNVYATANPNDRDGKDAATPTEVPVALTQSPLSVGSYLKRCQYNYSIREENNKDYGWLKSIADVNLSTAYINSSNAVSTRSSVWNTIWGLGWTNSDRYDGTDFAYNKEWADTWTAVGGFQDGEKFTVPTTKNFEALRDKCKFGYGIAYADGATETAHSITDATGYTDYNNSGKGTPLGMRVCVVYDDSDDKSGNNILFPLSAVGQARRTRTAPGPFNNNEPNKITGTSAGSISYGGVTQPMYNLSTNNNNYYRPLTYNLYRTPGAVYWIKKPVVTDKRTNSRYRPETAYAPDYASWDINYLTIVFNPYDYGSLGNFSSNNNYYQNYSAESSSDALPIKLIYK
ncbi:MAG: hypothetical protein K2M54_07345 [Muribaculaceae bacterium]|nr:hypothetical protein [Muribaculaceae bacterium]